jgi:hypothetical protein
MLQEKEVICTLYYTTEIVSEYFDNPMKIPEFKTNINIQFFSSYTEVSI